MGVLHHNYIIDITGHFFQVCYQKCDYEFMMEKAWGLFELSRGSGFGFGFWIRVQG